MKTVGAIAVLATLALAAPAHASVERFALIVGHDAGDRGEVPLRYAQADATKMYEVLSDLGGFRPENMVLLRGHDAGTVRRALITLNERIRTRIGEGVVDPLLFVYYSGHADQDALHLGGTSLELAELEGLVRGSAAKFRLLVVDACRSGALTRVKGGTRVAPFPIEIEERLAEEGLVYLTSTSANEDAQESDELKGSFFTHYFISGLSGAADTNGDGAVTLEEVYTYTFQHTIRATSRTWIGVQHPTFVKELRGRGGVVLTRLDRDSPRTARLASRSGRAFLVMQGSSDGQVVAEIAAGDQERVLYLRPGRYFVRSRAPDHLLEGDVEAQPGATVDLDALPLERIAYARLVRKGAGDLVAVHGVTAGYQLRTAIQTEGSALCQGAFAGYTVDFEGFTLAPRVSGCRSSQRQDSLTTYNDAFDVQVQIRHAWDLRFVTVETGVGLGGALLRQTFAFDDPERAVPDDRLTAAGLLSAGWSIGSELPGGLYVSAEATAMLYLFRDERRDPTMPTEGRVELAWPLAGQLGIALGKRW